MEKKISYLNRTFADYKQALIEFSQMYYPDMSTSYDDASVASWMIDLVASVADNESYHIDRAYQETDINSAQERSSLMAIARNNGIKVPGPKGSMAEVKVSITLPVDGSTGKEDYTSCPIIKKGTRFCAASQQFELLEDIDFENPFDENGDSTKTIERNVNSNGETTGYTVSKRVVVVAGESRIYRYEVRSSDVKPFMEILLPIENIMNIESILEVETEDGTVAPPYGYFYNTEDKFSNDDCDSLKIRRFYEVDSLAQQYAWSDSTAKRYEYSYVDVTGSSAKIIPTYCVAKGEWRPVTRKFITEYTDKGYMKIIFGAGVENEVPTLGEGMAEFSKWQISKILNNDNLGVLPRPGTFLFILYRIGGGTASNVAAKAINKISSLNFVAKGDMNRANILIKSLKVENITPSISGKDMPSNEELKYYIKYNNNAQNRCVTVKDYIDRILQLPPRYGTPFRVGVMEENNKIMVYLLGLNYKGNLDTMLPITLIKNIENYLSAYRMINDYVEIKSGRIIDLSFDVDVIVDKNYNKTDVVRSIINLVKDYMDINRHFMGEEIYVGDLQKEISKLDGVINLIDLRIYNNTDSANGYSRTQIGQETIPYSEQEDWEEKYGDDFITLIDIEATDGILYNEGDTMMEIKYPEKDIRVKVKER